MVYTYLSAPVLHGLNIGLIEVMGLEVRFSAEKITRVLQHAVGMIFVRVLEHAAVFKRTAEGREVFLRFIDQV